MRSGAIAAAAAVFLAAATGVCQTADEIIAKNLEAGDDTLPSVLELKRPSKSRWEFTLDGERAVQAFDGKGGWMWIPFAGQTEPQPMPEQEAKDAEQQADIDGPLVDYKQKGSTIELVGHDKDFRPSDWKLKVTLKSGEVRWVYLDGKTYLQTITVSKRKIDGVEVEIRSEVGDYRKVGALLLPHSFTASTNDGGQTQSLQFDKIEVNVPIDDDRFAMPTPKRPGGPVRPTPTPTVG
jgi:outer membrane lipoprotein-sorting protein